MRSSPLPVFAISLPRFKQRYAYIRAHLQARFGDGYEIVGIYGADAEAEAVPDHNLTPGQIGCALSHLEVYKRMIERNLQHAFVVEDDAILPRNICELLDDIRPHCSARGVVQLYNWNGGISECSTHMSVSVRRHLLCYPMHVSDLGSTLCYVIGREAAEGILSVNYPVLKTADDWGYFFEHGAFDTVRILHPSPIAVKPFETTVYASPHKNSHLAKARSFAKRTIFFPLVTVRRRMQLFARNRNTKLLHKESESIIST
jgi:glycosyl transferase family 25